MIVGIPPSLPCSPDTDSTIDANSPAEVFCSIDQLLFDLFKLPPFLAGFPSIVPPASWIVTFYAGGSSLFPLPRQGADVVPVMILWSAMRH
jgi:hypothetical protein